MHAVLIVAHLQVVFFIVPHTDPHLSGMVDQFPVAVAQVKILIGVGTVDPLHHLLDRAVIHIDQQHAPHGNASVRQLHDPAQGDDPVIAKGRGVKDILYMRR